MLTLKRKNEAEDTRIVKKESPEKEDDIDIWNEHHYSALPHAKEDDTISKWKGGVLKIIQVANGFAFTYYICDNSHPAKFGKSPGRAVVGFRYDIELSEGDFKERRSTVDYYSDEMRIYHMMPLPDQMIDVLSELMQKYHVSTLKIQSLLIDLKSLAKFEWLLTDHGANIISMRNVKFDRITDCHRKRFISLVRLSGVRFLEMNGQEQPTVQGLFNEKFMTDLAETQLERFFSNALSKLVYPHRFYPSKAILPALCGLQCFDAPAMVINSEWFVELLQLCIEGLDVPSLPFIDFNWRFAVDQNLSRDDIEEKMGPHFSLMNRGEEFLLIRANDGTTAKFSFAYHKTDEGRALSCIARVNFFKLEQTRDWLAMCNRRLNH